MWILWTACVILLQFEGESKHPTAAEFARTQSADLAKRRASLAARIPTQKQKSSRPQAAKAELAAINAELDAIAKQEKDIRTAPLPAIQANNATVGQIGYLMQREVINGSKMIGRNRVADIREETGPAQLKVIQSIDRTTMICTCVKTDIVIRNYKGPQVATGKSFTPSGIFFVSGHYRFDGELLTVLEPWKHEKEFQNLKPTDTSVADSEATQQIEHRAAEFEAKEWRMWADESGSEFEARYSGIVSGKVKLIKRDKTTVTLPAANLTEEQRDWIKKKPWIDRSLAPQKTAKP